VPHTHHTLRAHDHTSRDLSSRHVLCKVGWSITFGIAALEPFRIGTYGYGYEALIDRGQWASTEERMSAFLALHLPPHMLAEAGYTP
jgi:hypothetical protein